MFTSTHVDMCTTNVTRVLTCSWELFIASTLLYREWYMVNHHWRWHYFEPGVVLPLLPPKGLTGLYFAQIHFPISDEQQNSTKSSVVTISITLFRIPMDVSQLDKSDSDSESDWWAKQARRYLITRAATGGAAELVKVLSRVLPHPPSPTDTSSQIATLCHQSYITFSKGNNFMFGISSVVPLPVSVNHICHLIKLTS